jgi:hypothetical protein
VKPLPLRTKLRREGGIAKGGRERHEGARRLRDWKIIGRCDAEVQTRTICGVRAPSRQGGGWGWVRGSDTAARVKRIFHFGAIALKSRAADSIFASHNQEETMTFNTRLNRENPISARNSSPRPRTATRPHAGRAAFVGSSARQPTGRTSVPSTACDRRVHRRFLLL